MRVKTSLYLLNLLAILVAANDVRANETDRTLSVVDAMSRAWSGVHDYTMQVEKTERLVDGRVTRQSVLVKFRRPDQYYLKVLEGEGAGAELIYPKNEREPVAIAHPGGALGGLTKFLRRTVVLRKLVPTEFSLQDPRIIRGQHQTVLESNLGRTIELIADNIRLAAESGEGELQLREECSDHGQCLHRIDVRLPAEAGDLHRVVESDNLWSIATRYDLPMYVIWYNNPDMRDPTDLHPGRDVFIPRYYAARGHIWISKESDLLTKLEIFDGAGRLYERYEYSQVRTNVGLTDADFDIDNPQYDF